VTTAAIRLPEKKPRPGSTRVYLVRHGQVEGFEQHRYNGQGDVPLTSLGMEQYRTLQERLRNSSLSAVYSSDLTRCMEGARLLGEPHGLTPIPLPDLRELHIGQWQGITWQDLQQRYPRQWEERLKDIVHYRVPGGESLLDLSRRVLPALKSVVTAHTDAEVVVVGHGAVNRVILLDALGAPLGSAFRLEQSYGCLNVVDYFENGTSTVQLLNG
jgi:alpha-ribazole phosphatase/probable phosphoglycerate mutase